MSYSRRDILQSGLLGALVLACRSSPAKRPPQTTSMPVSKATGKARSCIFVYMAGGPCHLDLFDPKPKSRNAAGETAIDTALKGTQFSSRFPGLAAQAGGLSIIRSLFSKEGSHERAQYLMHSGFSPVGATLHPAMGAWVAKARPSAVLPGYVSLGGPGHPPGALGAIYTPFVVPSTLKPDPILTGVLSKGQEGVKASQTLRGQLNQEFAALTENSVAKGNFALTQAAETLMAAPQISAFDAAKESPATRERYGMNEFGQSCLVARRLVQESVPFIEVVQNGWDTHKDHYKRITPLCSDFDRGFCMLMADLKEQGLWDDTLIVCTGDFSRSPALNADGGRDHFPTVVPMMLTGGLVKTGMVIGQTDDEGEKIVSPPISIGDMFRTLATLLQIDPEAQVVTADGRPVKATDIGTPVAQLLPT